MPSETAQVVEKLRTALDLRKKYQSIVRKEPVEGGSAAASSSTTPAGKQGLEVRFGSDGLVHVCPKGSKERLFDVPSVKEYYDDMDTLFHIRSFGPVASYCYNRLRLMQTKFELYTMVSSEKESEQVQSSGHRDFYNVRKVDTHIHHSAAMNAKHLLRFIKKKLKTSADDVVDTQGGVSRTLGEVFMQLGISWTDLCLDNLQVWADKSCLHRFDRFNNKYSPFGQGDLRAIFLKTDNAMGGRYLAELTRELIDDLEDSKYQHAEWRLSIYGRKRSEWESLSKWVLGEGLGLGNKRKLLSPNLKWMIQIPRLFSLYKAGKQLNNFGEMLENIFMPIFEATLDPAAHPHVARFLEEVSGFDTVDDESKSEKPLSRTFSSKERTPSEWDIEDNPSYKYYSYFIHANLTILNRLRAMKGLNQFAYRPHAGEAGEVHHLDTAFLLADGINHGINLRKSPPLQYLFYLAQIGVAMSPCSNNQLFLQYEKSPFPVYFARGLNVSLSTDDPLMFHQTKEPLMEEYSIAKQLWHLTSVDLCEIARNSVVQSGFSDETKAHWLGTQNFMEENLPQYTNVPVIRWGYRKVVFREEMSILAYGSPSASFSSKPSFNMYENLSNLLLLSPKSGPKTTLPEIGEELSFGKVGEDLPPLHTSPWIPGRPLEDDLAGPVIGAGERDEMALEEEETSFRPGHLSDLPTDGQVAPLRSLLSRNQSIEGQNIREALLGEQHPPPLPRAITVNELKQALHDVAHRQQVQPQGLGPSGTAALWMTVGILCGAVAGALLSRRPLQ